MKIMLFTTGLLCFVAFCWGVKAHFRQTGAMPLGMRAVSLLSLAWFIWFGWRELAWPSGYAALTLALFAASLAVFYWAIAASRLSPPTLAFDTDQPEFLLCQGPYRYVRHPFYLAYLLFWTGTATATPGLVGWAAPGVMFLVYFEAASREERKFSTSQLAAAYDAYRRQAGMFFPVVS
jgi:protein-S-isoprenylcysteine O-methyltransferase Ste14